MGRFRSITARWIVPIAIFVALLGIVLWIIRPSPFAEWLRAEGIAIERPVEVISDWVHGQRAPLTPTGFVTLFSRTEIAALFGLIAALFVLSAAIWPPWLTRWFQAFPAKPAVPLRNARSAIRGVRVWLAMVLIAVFALYLGWEIHAWRALGVSARYRRVAAEYAASEADCRLALTSTKNELAKLESGPPLKLPDESLTPAAQAAIRSYLVDSFRRGSATLEALCEDYDRLKQKYERAASAPGSPVGPDPPLHERQSGENVEWPNWRNYLRANVDYGALIRRYPDLYWAHERQAWLLATSPDPSYRDGPRAVAAALRAAELTKWNDAHVLSTLAAAYAEAGDFAKAVISQQRALAAPPTASSANVLDLQNRLKAYKARLALYQSGKPFRLAP